MDHRPKCTRFFFFKIIEDNIGKYLHDFGVKKIFFKKKTQKATIIIKDLINQTSLKLRTLQKKGPNLEGKAKSQKEIFYFIRTHTSNKMKNTQIGLYQTKKLLYRYLNHQQSEKTTYGMGKNICKSYI